MKEQLKTNEGDLENLLDNENLVFSQWIKNFTNVPVVLSFKTRESKIVSLSPVSFFEHKL